MCLKRENLSSNLSAAKRKEDHLEASTEIQVRQESEPGAQRGKDWGRGYSEDN
jgi:hypothetical protein